MGSVDSVGSLGPVDYVNSLVSVDVLDSMCLWVSSIIWVATRSGQERSVVFFRTLVELWLTFG